jgi:hypothetical protein
MTDDDVHTDEPEQRGIFDGFDGYAPRSEEDWKNTLRNGLVVVDTNVLLSLYRYDQDARNSLLSTLRAFGPRLWVPNQVLVEFWRNHPNALEYAERQLEQAVSLLKGDLERAHSNLRSWVNRVSLDRESAGNLERILSEAHDKVVATMAEVTQKSREEMGRDTTKDNILLSLESILQGKVGAPLDARSYAQAIEEGKRRLEAKIPPGYMDKKKEGQGNAFELGDYLVWVQVKREAIMRAKDVLLVTGDAKEDWWRTHHQLPLGPRNELAEELLREAGVHLYMLKPDRLLRYARDLLAVAVSEETVQSIEQVGEAYFAAYRQYVREQGHFPNARQFSRYLPSLYGGTPPKERDLVSTIRDMRYRFQSEADTEHIP